MHVHLVYHGDIYAWILGKFARNLRHELEALGIEVSDSERVEPKADVNHHIVHYELDPAPGTVETRMITHIDSIDKLETVRKQLGNGSTGICLSRETMMNLAGAGIPRKQLCYINPAHDGLMQPRPLLIGTSCRVHEDGRKREVFLETLAEKLDPREFAFAIMGEGWDRQVRILQEHGFTVSYTDHFDRDAYRDLIPRLDYYLYMGMDEGQMGWLDAVAAGIKTIATAQGFHLDAENGMTHPYTTRAGLVDIFMGIQHDRRAYRGSVAEWRWPRYAAKHLEIWHYLAACRNGIVQPRPTANSHDGISSLIDIDRDRESLHLFGRTRYTAGLVAGYIRRKINIRMRSSKK